MLNFLAGILILIGDGEAFADSAVPLDAHGNVTNGSGAVLMMSVKEALSACPLKMHLITIREISQIATQWGSRISEKWVPGFAHIETVELDDKRDSFFYSPVDYPRLYSSGLFWTSSRPARDSSTQVFLFDGVSGEILPMKPGDLSDVGAAAKCLPDSK